MNNLISKLSCAILVTTALFLFIPQTAYASFIPKKQEEHQIELQKYEEINSILNEIDSKTLDKLRLQELKAMEPYIQSSITSNIEYVKQMQIIELQLSNETYALDKRLEQLE